MPIETWATVRVEDTGDGLIIHPDDAKKWRLITDHQYSGYFLPDGRYRIALTHAPEQTAAADTAYDPTTQPYDEPFRHVAADTGQTQGNAGSIHEALEDCERAFAGLTMMNANAYVRARLKALATELSK